MAAWEPPDLNEVAENVEFDRLCGLCTELFDGTVHWPEYHAEPYFHPHYNIKSLARSAEGRCHLCSLIFSKIQPKHVKQLKHDIKFGVALSRHRLGIRIRQKDKSKQLMVFYIGTKNKGVGVDDPNSPKAGYHELGRLLTGSADLHTLKTPPSKALYNCCESTISGIKRWLCECSSTHDKCLQFSNVAATRKLLPTRLLDLNSAVKTGYVRLVESNNLPQDTRFATLSHCWGGKCAKALTADNLHEFNRGVPVSSMPKTFRDAIALTPKLGVTYLWIDACCIIQDSVDDWLQESSIMGDVFANSHFTLAAAASFNSEGGLLQKRNPLSAYPCTVPTTWTCFEPGRLLLPAFDHTWQAAPNPKCLDGRAWVFQELLLSMRLIYFDSNQVSWECYSLKASEQDQCKKQRTNDLLSNYKARMVTAWKSGDADIIWKGLRQIYSQKSLTVSTDRLTAFAGIGRMMHKMLGSPSEDYLAGLWKPNLLQELLWSGIATDAAEKDSYYIAPSWSWASVGSRGISTRDPSSSWDVKVLDVWTCPVDDPFGPVIGGGLVLQCSLYDITISAYSVQTGPHGLHGAKLSAIEGGLVNYVCSGSFDRPTKSTLISFSFVPMCHGPQSATIDESPEFSVLGLLLHATETKRGQYCRAGILDIRTDPETDFDSFLSNFQRKDPSDETSYLDRGLEDEPAIEII